MPLINCEITFEWKCFKDGIPVVGGASNQNSKIKITGAKLYVPVVTLSFDGNLKLLKQLEFGFKGTIKWNKHLRKTTNRARKDI